MYYVLFFLFLDLQFCAAYVPCGAQYLDAVKQTLEQIDLIKRMVDRYSDYLRLAVDAKGEPKEFLITLFICLYYVSKFCTINKLSI